MSTSAIKLEISWKNHLEGEFSKPYMARLKEFLLDEKKKGKIIYPSGGNIFFALNSISFDKVKVIVIGQDPYHGPGQAHGLCFSVQKGCALPPSLLNIFKEIQRDLGIAMPKSGDLTSWAKQGVLLLNATLTVEAHKAGSHQGKGWEEFTNKIISVLSEKREHLVFMLWGSFAQKKSEFINLTKHLILKSAHPSPLSAHRGFLGNSHFSKVNAYLKQTNQEPINW